VNFDPKKTIFLIDGSSFLYRAYYGLRPLSTPKGAPVQAVYGFCRMIKKLIDTFNPQYIALVWDSKGKTTRHEVYAEYKAMRDAPPSDLFVQKEYITKFANMIGLKQLQTPGLEADDIMYSVAKEQRKAASAIVFVTSDKDMGQAIDDKVVMYDTFKDLFIDQKAFEDKMGFEVEKLPFYFAMLGDASDNIPGVRGIGKKGATELVLQFDSLEDLYANLDKVKKPRIRAALEENKDNAFLSRNLFLLQYHKTGIGKKNLSFDAKNWQKARPLFRELNFKSLLKDMPVTMEQMSLFENTQEKKRPRFKPELITTQEQLDSLAKTLKTSKAVALDTETDGLRPLEDKPVGISFAIKEGEAYYIPFGHTSGEQLPMETVVQAIKPIMEDPLIKKWLHNAKFDALVLAHMGITMRGLDFDSMLAASLLIQNGPRIGLKNLSIYLFDEQMLTFQEVVKANKYKDFTQVPLDLALNYAAADAHQTFKIAQVLQKKLKKLPTLEKLYYTIEHPLIDVLIAMEREGIHVDASVLTKLGKKVDKELAELREQIIALVGKQFIDINLNSPKQVEQLLFYELKLPPQKKTTKGLSYSTDAQALSALAQLHVVPGLILRYRELFKLTSTYIDALPGYINPRNERVHTTFSQTAVATGRLASSDPNLQNIPAASGYGIEIRKAFKPKSGNAFISADYSQIELRVLAFLSKDKQLVDAFLRGTDIHRQTAAKLFGIDPDLVTHQQRQIGKRINFSILYGLTPYGLSKDLNIPFADAKKYIETYFAQYPQVKDWMESVTEETKKQGYATTLWGRRRYIPGIYEANRALYEEAKRVAINTRAQGTAAEIMKQGMIALEKAFKKANLNAQILLQIHDELLISAPERQAQEVEKITQEILENVTDWSVPLVANTRVGRDWKEVTK